MTTRYAENTTVSVERSKAEIEQLVIRYGASAFQSGWQEGEAVVGFVMKDRRIRFHLRLPRRDEEQFTCTPVRNHARSPKQSIEAWEQACRQRWRALCLAIKAKLEAVDVGISAFENEFLAFIVDPGTNRTVGEQIIPQIAASYEHIGSNPIALLPAPGVIS